MIEAILKKTESDPKLERLFEQTAEYARLYLMAKERQKGCDGLGSVAMIKEEFREMLDELLKYCSASKIIQEEYSVDLDAIAKKMDSVGK